LDADFIEELCGKELANPWDGLVSPVDLQILAWMTMRHRDPAQRTFDRTSFQRFGGLEGLLNRFLEQRVNEWLGNGESSRYMLRWRDLRLIKGQRPHLTSRKNRKQKEGLIQRSQVRMRRIYAVGLVATLVPAGLYGRSQTPQGQTWLMQEQHADEILNTANPEALTLAAQAFVAAGSIEQARVTVGRISQPEDKADALQSLAQRPPEP